MWSVKLNRIGARKKWFILTLVCLLLGRVVLICKFAVLPSPIEVIGSKWWQPRSDWVPVLQRLRRLDALEHRWTSRRLGSAYSNFKWGSLGSRHGGRCRGCLGWFDECNSLWAAFIFQSQKTQSVTEDIHLWQQIAVVVIEFVRKFEGFQLINICFKYCSFNLKDVKIVIQATVLKRILLSSL